MFSVNGYVYILQMDVPFQKKKLQMQRQNTTKQIIKWTLFFCPDAFWCLYVYVIWGVNSESLGLINWNAFLIHLHSLFWVRISFQAMADWAYAVFVADLLVRVHLILYFNWKKKQLHIHAEICAVCNWSFVISNWLKSIFCPKWTLSKTP